MDDWTCIPARRVLAATPSTGKGPRKRAPVTGKWRDVGRFKGPILRGLAARPPYFHNGFADSLDDVVEFYDTRFAMQLNPREKRDLVAFLRSCNRGHPRRKARLRGPFDATMQQMERIRNPCRPCHPCRRHRHPWPALPSSALRPPSLRW